MLQQSVAPNWSQLIKPEQTRSTVGHTVKQLLNLVVVLVVAVWLLQTFGIIGSLKALQIR